MPVKNKLLNQEQIDELTAQMRADFSPEYFRTLYSEFPKERVEEYFGRKQKPGVASALWSEDPKSYLRAKMAGVYRDHLPNQLHRNLRLNDVQLNNLHPPKPSNDGPTSDNKQYKERLR